MTPDLPALRAVLAAGTPRPWDAGNDWISVPCDCTKPDCDGRIFANWNSENGLCWSDNELIVAAVNNLEPLLDALERAQAELYWARHDHARATHERDAVNERCVEQIDRLKALRAERDSLSAQLATVTAERDALRTENERIRDDRDEADAAWRHAYGRVLAAHHQLDADGIPAGLLDERLTVITAQRDAAIAECERMRPREDELDSVMSLLSWCQEKHDRDSATRQWLERVVASAIDAHRAGKETK